MSHSNSWLFGTAQDVERYRAERGREGEEMREIGDRVRQRSQSENERHRENERNQEKKEEKEIKHDEVGENERDTKRKGQDRLKER